VEVTSCILLDHSGIEPGINKRNYRKYTNTWRWCRAVYSSMIIEEIRREI
jgi:hypothetical protein